jgi:hypothetical protein
VLFHTVAMQGVFVERIVSISGRVAIIGGGAKPLRSRSSTAA